MVKRSKTMGLDGGSQKSLKFRVWCLWFVVMYYKFFKTIKKLTITEFKALQSLSKEGVGVFNSPTHIPQNLPANVLLHTLRLQHAAAHFLND